MKNIFLFIIFAITISCNAQIYPLRTYTEIPENAHLNDTNNELPYYEGIWTGTWNNKTIYITFKKITNKYNSPLKYYKDFLIGKFKIVKSNGEILFDNTHVSDENPKIRGGKFRKKDNKYSLIYSDSSMCDRNGYGTIYFMDASKTKLEWKFSEGEVMIDTDCFYYNQTWPEILPASIILTKQ